MKAALISKLEDGNCTKNITVVDDVQKPTRKPKELLIKVLAVATSVGDCHVKSGRCSLVLNPKMPYIPGQDFCGLVEECDEKSAFKVGDIVLANQEDVDKGAIAEYAVAPETHCIQKPLSMTPETCAASLWGVTAQMAVDKARIKAGKTRVLVLGGAGAVGYMTIQFLKARGSAYIATTSTQNEMLLKLGADKVIDYTKEDWWTIQEFKNEPFDIIIDTVGGGNHFRKASKSGVLKKCMNGGNFIAVTGDDPKPVIKSVWSILKLFFIILGRPIWTLMIFWSVPKYTAFVCLPDAKMLRRLVREIEEHNLKTILDPRCAPYFEFTTEGVQKAFQLQESGHAHGKVVIQVAKLK